jgi:hypothetical protein
MPKKSQLDVIREQVTYKEEEDEEDSKDSITINAKGESGGGGGGTGRVNGIKAKKGSTNAVGG